MLSDSQYLKELSKLIEDAPQDADGVKTIKMTSILAEQITGKLREIAKTVEGGDNYAN